MFAPLVGLERFFFASNFLFFMFAPLVGLKGLKQLKKY